MRIYSCYRSIASRFATYRRDRIFSTACVYVSWYTYAIKTCYLLLKSGNTPTAAWCIYLQTGHSVPMSLIRKRASVPLQLCRKSTASKLHAHAGTINLCRAVNQPGISNITSITRDDSHCGADTSQADDRVERCGSGTFLNVLVNRCCNFNKIF